MLIDSVRNPTLPSPIRKCDPPACRDLNPVSTFQLQGRLQPLGAFSLQVLKLIGMIVVAKPCMLFDAVHPWRACTEHAGSVSPKKMVCERPSVTSFSRTGTPR